ncbi:MAG: CoA ester lyase [Acidimicrobiia bacterium]|nr:CoA ester lyase [Acidimicrobiia bacterium]
MSARTRELPRRSCLSVPGASEKMLAKGPTLDADMVFLDMEDSVSPLEKESARDKVVTAVRDQDWGEKVLCVRVNAWDTKWTVGDITTVVGNAGERLDEIMLPKVESAAEVVAADMVLRQVEENAGLPIGHIGIEAQIETARGMIDVEEICAASSRLETVILGPVDMSASMEMPSLGGGLDIPGYPGDYFHYVFVKILMAGRANGLQVIDGPYVKVRDPEGFRDYTRRAMELGFDGKWALHPDQITILNEMFSPTQEQYDKALAILETYAQATTTGDRKGAVMYGDEMIDEASRKVCLKIAARGERSGMIRSTG